MTYKPHKMLPRKDIEAQVTRCELNLENSILPETRAYYKGMIEAYKNVLG
jgi:hypothetical protein